MTAQIPNNLVFGYHGTSSAHVESILRHGLEPSVKPWDWLGHAIYFWEGDRDRAAEWGRRKCEADGGSPVILRATIDLSRCFDLTVQKYRDELASIANIVINQLTPDVLDQMRQTTMRHDLDCLILNTLFSSAKDDDGTSSFSTVRGLFREGEPLFTAGDLASNFYDRDHIQIGVLDKMAIVDIAAIAL